MRRNTLRYCPADLDDGSTTTTSVFEYPSTNNKLDAITQSSVPVRSFTHDGAGNITADTRGATTYNYRYNKRGRLDRLTIGSTVTADYVYDGLERLAIRTTQNMTPAGTTHYVYDLSGRLIVEASSAGNTLREYIWIDDMPLAVVSDVDTMSPNLYFVHPDHLDRPSVMTDGSQASVWDATYLPFGAVHAITGSASNNQRFPGQYFLLESGLHYNWHRHYDPTLGRYIQPDPMEFVDGPSIYAYAKSTPAMKADPRGLQSNVIPRPGFTPIPPGVFDEWRRHAEKGIAGLIGACRRVFAGGGNGDGDREPDCKEEIRKAREICTEAYANGWRSNHDVGPYKKTGGGPWTIQDCMRGLISERCGGNAI